MKRAPFFKLLQYRTFNFTTRHYDAEKEERDARIKALREKYTDQGNKEKSAEGLERSISFSKERARRTERKPILIRAAILVGIFALLYMFFK
ncbi:hypothetical protein [Flammeovirga kamogawensis]|uniref:Uncharacterized protein n=1 Tax=Flammeovirga kamogawensis TaxID=373891 RepID=A0ABX8GRB6_9BACT|nr:hypothetical protein [Flammeovirga kamogawensis]MBB6463209.1 hypothetical protein [Flammeovirga kamogawensis]QWG05939.1 hypothetical protein KM029_11220 [Flammeovirga kamogawensis]TRX67764.1 hypothetical protein EO216_06230 [Flammeovirga kamogawensis]